MLVIESLFGVVLGQLVDLLLVHAQLIFRLSCLVVHDGLSWWLLAVLFLRRWRSVGNLLAWHLKLIYIFFWIGGIKGFDLDVNKALCAHALFEILEGKLLQVLVWVGIVSKVELGTSEEGIIAKMGKESSFLWLGPIGDCIPLNKSLHINFLAKLSKSTLINLHWLSFEIVGTSLESEVTHLVLQI